MRDDREGTSTRYGAVQFGHGTLGGWEADLAQMGTRPDDVKEARGARPSRQCWRARRARIACASGSAAAATKGKPHERLPLHRYRGVRIRRKRAALRHRGADGAEPREA